METNNSSSETLDALNVIARRVEMQQENLKLEVMFQRNMVFFKEKNPKVYELFLNYNPTNLKLMYTDDGYVNLVNHNLNDKPVYNSEPREFSQRYVDQYEKDPSFYRIDTKTTKAIDEENDAHIFNMNRLINHIQENEEVVVGRKLQQDTNFLLMMGLGLGYQITQLLEKTDIHHLVILEPHEDIFFASLHTLDWQQLHQHFEQKNHTLQYFVGKTASQCFDSLQQHLRQIGLFNVVKPFLFEHLSSVEMKETSKEFFNKLPSALTALGYFDDEQVSLSHTVENYRNENPILRDHALINKRLLDRPAIIVGNGPSLDKAKAMLEKYGDDAVIFSCGTALGALRKLGIKPDFHIEMERTRPVVEWIQTSTDEEYREDIILLALNTVHPDALRLFKRKGIGMKSNDLGTHYLCQYVGKDEFIVNLMMANPTVSNTGLAFATALGFKEIYLVGTDLGFPAGEKHHSSLSAHYDVKDEHVEGLDLYKHDAKGNITVDGNFGDQIVTTAVYNHSRITMQSLLNTHPDVKCYNTSEGVLIPNAEPIRCDDVVINGGNFDKLAFNQNLFAKYFHGKGLKKMKNEKEILKTFEYSLTICNDIAKVLAASPSTIMAATALLDELHLMTLKLGFDKKTQYVYSLFKGSFAGFSLALAKTLYSKGSEESSVALFNECKQYYLDFLAQAKTKVSKELLKLDNKERQLKDKLK